MKAGNVHVTSLFSLYTFIYLIPIPPSLCYLILFECHHSFMHFVRVYIFFSFSFNVLLLLFLLVYNTNEKKNALGWRSKFPALFPNE
jgi:hypothetical protein